MVSRTRHRSPRTALQRDRSNIDVHDVAALMNSASSAESTCIAESVVLDHWDMYGAPFRIMRERAASRAAVSPAAPFTASACAGACLDPMERMRAASRVSGSPAAPFTARACAGACLDPVR